MANFLSGLSITDRNTDIPFFPNVSWILTVDDLDLITLPTFNWIQVFYTAPFTGIPNLAVFSGAYHDDGTPLVSYVPFYYPGVPVPIKGNGIFTTGKDIRGDTINTTPIADFLQIVAYGGMR